MKLEELLGKKVHRAKPITNRNGTKDTRFRKTTMLTLSELSSDTITLTHDVWGVIPLHRERWDDGNWRVVG